jgi:anti-sigma regulatory factor (Ser/Thr protein kinase)
VENLTLEERKIGGLGIPFMMEIMDKVEYQRKGDTNELTLIKYFSSF